MDKKQYNFDGCCPQTLIESATVKNGRIAFPDGMSYALLVLPECDTMTVALARKLRALHDAGAVILGCRPKRSPSLEELDQDAQVRELTAFLPEPGVVAKSNEPQFQIKQSVKTAKWLWSDPQYNSIVPNVMKKFVREFDLPDAFAGKGAIGIAADNVYVLYINGERVGTGETFQRLNEYNISRFLKPGKNRIEALIINGGDHPTPAGFIAVAEILDGNEKTVIPTDALWTYQGQSAAELGPYNMGPWGLNVDQVEPTYPEYEQTCAELEKQGVAPDFESTGEIRWIHRVDGDQNLYFIGNRCDYPQTVDCTFRALGQAVELWNPYSGKRYRIEKKREQDGRTTILIPFEAAQSWFVVFTSQPTADMATLPSVETLIQKPQPTAALALAGTWNVTFNQDAATGRTTEQGKLRTVAFNSLTDWSKNDDPMIRYYSGQAVYELQFDANAALVASQNVSLDLGDVAVMARVELNSRDLGIVWFKPWTVDVPAGLLVLTGNRLKITVANLWCNRLIGDASLPNEQKSTWTTQGFYGPGDGQLQRSGLLGPVRLIAR